MDIQFYGANCITVTYKGARIVIDDNLEALGAKSITKADDVSLYTSKMFESSTPARLTFDGPGEYEVSDISIIGITAQAHMDDPGKKTATMYKLVVSDLSILVTGHISSELTENLLETIGIIDVLIVPVGGNGYTVDPVGAVKLVKGIDPKVVIPTQYADKGLNYEVPMQDLDNAIKEMGMEVKETVSKLKVKPQELSEVTQLTVLERS